MIEIPEHGNDLGPAARPHWLIRWGVLTILAVMALFLAAAAVVPYSEQVSVPLQFAPRRLTAARRGRVHWLVREGEAVAPGQPIAEVAGEEGTIATAVVPPGAGPALDRSATVSVQVAATEMPGVVIARLRPTAEGIPVRVKLAGAVPGGAASLRIYVDRGHLLDHIIRLARKQQ